MAAYLAQTCRPFHLLADNFAGLWRSLRDCQLSYCRIHGEYAYVDGHGDRVWQMHMESERGLPW